MTRFILTISLILGASIGHAIDIKALEKCDEFEDAMAQLACRIQVIDSAQSGEQIATLSAWDVSVDKSKFDDSTNVFLRVRSLENTSCGFGYKSRTHANLWVRCRESTTALIIATDCHLVSGHGGYGNVDLRVDDKKAFTMSFEDATSNKALGLWSGNKAIPVIKKLFGGTEWIARFTPFSKNQETVTFPIAGLEESIKPLRKACGW